MSELQIALLAIGLIVIIAVYLFGWWQQKQYRQKFGATFKHEHDPLYQEKQVEEIFTEPVNDFISDEPEIKLAPEPAIDTANEVENNTAPTEAILADSAETEVASPVQPAESTQSNNEHKKAAVDLFSLIDKHFDFIIEIEPKNVSSVNFLDGLWQRKFDFAKTIYIFAQTNNAKSSPWERINHESVGLYQRFRISLQMVDRNGAIHHAELASFHDLLHGIAQKSDAEFNAPDIHEAHQYAIAIDAFCASVDQIIGINLVPSDERDIPARRIANTTTQHGINLEADGLFHFKDPHGHSLFTIGKTNNKPFQPYHIDTDTTNSLILLLDIPRVSNPTDIFDQMVEAAQVLARELQLNLVDDHLVVLNNAGLKHIRAEIEDIEYKMRNSIITPGSEQALRLFS